jgi:hypothetical protein
MLFMYEKALAHNVEVLMEEWLAAKHEQIGSCHH